MLSMLSKKMDNVKVEGNSHVNPRLSSSDSGNIWYLTKSFLCL